MAQKCLFGGGLLILAVIATGVVSQETRTFTIVNNCKETIWPGITQGEGFNSSGFALKPSQSAVYTASSNWNGRIWGRTGCNFDKNGNGTCQTGGCGGSLNCTDPGSPPATIADFTLGSPDFYDVSLVDGFNLPIVITPLKGKENCSSVGCDGDLRQNCSKELVLKSSSGEVIACRSACEVFNTDEYCCRGTYAKPETCQPTNYSRAFKSVCPLAYSYAYDDPTSVKTCTGADYVVSFFDSIPIHLMCVLFFRNETLCSYHDSSLACSGSTGFRTPIPAWLVIIMIISLLLTSVSPNKIHN